MNSKLYLTVVFLILIALSTAFGFTPGQARQMSSAANEYNQNEAPLGSNMTIINGCVELLTNGSFESGSISPWVESSNHAKTLLSTVRPRESQYSVFLGNANRADDELYQGVILPLEATSLTLTYWYTSEASDSPERDAMSITLRSGKGERLRTLNTINAETNLEWQDATHDLMDYRGQSLQIHFRGVVGSNNRSNFSVDDISLQACGVPTPTPTPTPTATPLAQHELFLPLLLGGE